MQEVEAVCDRILIIKDGKLIADSPKSQIQDLWKDKEIISVEFKEKTSTSLLKNIPGVEQVVLDDNGVYKISVNSKTDIRPLIYDLAKSNNLTLIGLQSEEIKLEHIFQELTQK